MNYQKIIAELGAEKIEADENLAIADKDLSLMITGYKTAIDKAMQIVREHSEGEDKQNKINNTQHEMD